VRITIRAFAHDRLLFTDSLEVSAGAIEKVIPALAEKHLDCLADYPQHMIEIQYLDEPDPLQRYFRFGTDPAGMVRPVAVNLEENPSWLTATDAERRQLLIESLRTLREAIDRNEITAGELLQRIHVQLTASKQ